MPEPLPEEVVQMFGAPNFAYLATLMPDGSPQVSPVWVDVADGYLRVNTAEGRTKPRNVRGDPRVAISVLDQKRPYSWAQVRGRVVDVRRQGALEHINQLSRNYLGIDYPLPEGMERVILVIEPDHVSYAIRRRPGRQDDG
ncbi:MAG: PPOX class F420-dependent oxidoreductase [Acidimicrobiia bacterium]